MTSVSTVDISPSLLSAAKAFRLRKTRGLGALICAIDKKALVLSVEDEFASGSLDDLVEELPENSPRFVLTSYELTHRDGRVSFPLFIIYWAPTTSSMELSTLYASALSNFSVAVDVAKVIDIRDGELDSHILHERLGA